MDAASLRFTWLYATSQLKIKYRYTLLGFLWNFLEPGLYLIILSIVFSVVNRMNTIDYSVFLFSALIPWRYFEKTVNTCTDSIVGADWLLKKMYVSPLSFPLTRWIVASVEFLFSFSVVLLIYALLRGTWTLKLIVLPLSAAVWSLFGLGVGIIMAVLYTFFRDIRPIVQMGLMFVFFSSPILFKAETFGDGSLQASLLRLHPITYFAALFQKPVYSAAWPDSIDWIIALAVSLTSLALGYYLIIKYRSRFYFYL